MTVAPNSPAHIARLADDFAFQGYIERTEHRAVSLQQLERVVEYARANCQSWNGLLLKSLNLYHLTTWLIKPATAASNSSFVELLASVPQIPDWFITHWWGECILHFVQCVEKHVETRALCSRTLYWICAYANRQHSIVNEIGTDPRQSSFFCAMRMAKGVLLVLDAGTEQSGPATPFERVWCVFEISVATSPDMQGEREIPLLLDIATYDTTTEEAELLTDGLTHQEKCMEIECGAGLGVQEKMRRERNFPFQIFRAGLQLELERASASVEADRVAILNCIAGRELHLAPLASHESYTCINKKLRSIFAVAAWRQACENRAVAELGLPAVLAADTERCSLSLDFSSCPQMDDEGASLLGTSIPRQLQSFSLSFYDCKKIGNAAAVALGKNLPENLHTLDLNFMGCSKISSVGVTVLVSRLPRTLRTLSLCFYGSHSMGDEALKSLALKLTPQLQELHLDFEFCRQITDAGLAYLADGLPSMLKCLDLHLRDCSEVGNAGLSSLAKALPGGLSTLELSFRRSQSVCDKGLRSLAECIPPSIRVLRLNFRRCEKVTNAGIVALSKALPPKLETLLLNCYACKSIGDDAASSVAEHLPLTVKALVLCFEETQVGERGVKALADHLPVGIQTVQLQVWSGEESLNLAMLRSWPVPRQLKTEIPKTSHARLSLSVKGAQNESRDEAHQPKRLAPVPAKMHLSSRANLPERVSASAAQASEHSFAPQEAEARSSARVTVPSIAAASHASASSSDTPIQASSPLRRSPATSGSVHVVCRIRPFSAKERRQEDATALQVVGADSLELRDDSRLSSFTVDAVLSPGSQQEAFEECRAVVPALLAGRNSSVIAYGQTGAGKTYTIHGPPNSLGVLYRTAQELFQAIEKDNDGVRRLVKASVLELYRQDLVDLIMVAQEGRGHSRRLQLRTTKEGEVQIEGLIEKSCSSLNDLLDTIRLGTDARRVMATMMNSESSRSHLIVTIKVDTIDQASSQKYSGKLHFCDLAGSERLQKSQVTGDGAREAIEINKSLTALGDVCNALQKQQRQIPYRNHKLTMLLQDSLGGSAITTLFVNCSLASSNSNETLMSLKFGCRARCHKGSQSPQVAPLPEPVASVPIASVPVASVPVASAPVASVPSLATPASATDAAIAPGPSASDMVAVFTAEAEPRLAEYSSSIADGVVQLRSMGFSALSSYNALQKEEGDLGRAVDRLLREGGHEHQPAASTSAVAAQRASSTRGERRGSRARRGRARSAAAVRSRVSTAAQATGV